MIYLRHIWLFLVDTAQTFGIAAAIFLVIYFLIARPFQVSGQSMYPTYRDGEYLFTDLVTPRFGTLKYGDVVVFYAPPASHESGKDFIKRVIGTPGDRIEISEGAVYKNGEPLDESYYLASDVKTFAGSFLQEDKEIVVPNNYIFVMGDNRQFSSDSREWGFLEEKAVIGKSIFVYWPLTQMRMIRNQE